MLTKKQRTEYRRLEKRAAQIADTRWASYAERDSLDREAREVNVQMNNIIRTSGAKNLSEFARMLQASPDDEILEIMAAVTRTPR